MPSGAADPAQIIAGSDSNNSTVQMTNLIDIETLHESGLQNAVRSKLEPVYVAPKQFFGNMG